MKSGAASGVQAAFLVFAVTLLAVPLSRAILDGAQATPQEAELFARAVPFAVGALAIVAFPGLRRAACRDLAAAVPGDRRLEVALVTVLYLALPFAAVLGLALWIESREGLLGLERRMASSPQAQMAQAFSAAGLAWLALVSTAGPILEELVFRGFLYRAFERQWGWVPAMAATSVLFGLYHPHFFAAFLASVVLVCVLRRTGSLRSSIGVHAFGNLMLWHPFAGQHLLPRPGEVSDPMTWRVHLACLLVAAIAVPLYAWMARRTRYDHAALPQ